MIFLSSTDTLFELYYFTGHYEKKKNNKIRKNVEDKSENSYKTFLQDDKST